MTTQRRQFNLKKAGGGTRVSIVVKKYNNWVVSCRGSSHLGALPFVIKVVTSRFWLRLRSICFVYYIRGNKTGPVFL